MDVKCKEAHSERNPPANVDGELLQSCSRPRKPEDGADPIVAKSHTGTGPLVAVDRAVNPLLLKNMRLSCCRACSPALLPVGFHSMII